MGYKEIIEQSKKNMEERYNYKYEESRSAYEGLLRYLRDKMQLFAPYRGVEDGLGEMAALLVEEYTDKLLYFFDNAIDGKGGQTEKLFAMDLAAQKRAQSLIGINPSIKLSVMGRRYEGLLEYWIYSGGKRTDVIMLQIEFSSHSTDGLSWSIDHQQ